MFTNADFDIQAIALPEARKQNRHGQARHLTEADLVAIFNALPDEKWRCLFAIAYFTGSRISEVLKLTVADVTAERMLFRAANTKMRKTRVALVVPQLQAFLDDYDFPASGYLFPAHHNGDRAGHLSRQGADWLLRQVCEAVGLEGVSTHSFRRSFATNLYHNGEPLAKICRLLGHKDLTMTARYIG